MKAIIINEQTLDDARDALLDSLKASCDSHHQNASAKVEYRTVHYQVTQFVKKMKESGL